MEAHPFDPLMAALAKYKSFPDLLESIRMIFARLDESGDGELDKKEVTEGLPRIFPDLVVTNEDWHAMIDSHDADAHNDADDHDDVSPEARNPTHWESLLDTASCIPLNPETRNPNAEAESTRVACGGSAGRGGLVGGSHVVSGPFPTVRPRSPGNSFPPKEPSKSHVGVGQVTCGMWVWGRWCLRELKAYLLRESNKALAGGEDPEYPMIMMLKWLMVLQPPPSTLNLRFQPSPSNLNPQSSTLPQPSTHKP